MKLPSVAVGPRKGATNQIVCNPSLFPHLFQMKAAKSRPEEETNTPARLGRSKLAHKATKLVKVILFINTYNAQRKESQPAS